MFVKISTGLIILIIFQMCLPGDQPMNEKDHPYTNALINESSPYLLQHAHNPVDWYPWGEEALRKAKKEDKLLIVSIGYAACHWCHVMEHESFEDEQVAKIMNGHFVAIKVDREERPDIDDIYMTACNLVSGRGGWPLNAVAMPDGRPIWAGTYFPKKQWINILQQFIQLKKENPERLEDSAAKITKGIQSVDELILAPGEKEFTQDEMRTIAQRFIGQIDMTYGGRSGAPKFPMPNNYEFLLKYHVLTGDENARKAVTITLDQMAQGGIYDQIGGGFARYSVDDRWIVPHFEKMLYDNAQLISLYADMYRYTKDLRYANIVEQSIEFIERELSSPEGAFYSSLDADSEGEEGKFYVWQKSELDSLLGQIEHHQAALEYYGVREDGNWEEGKNILLIDTPLEEIAKRHELSVDQLQQAVETCRSAMMSHRESRVRPGLDDKVLTSWNALMIKSYADSFKALKRPEYLEKAQKSAQFILDKQKQGDHRLNRNYKDGKSSINAFLDDYALLIQALVALYEISFEEEWLVEADLLTRYVVEHFYNEENSMFFYTSDIDPPLVARKTEFNDNVIPSSNSIMARNLRVLGELLYKQEYADIAAQMMLNMKRTILEVREPSFYSNWCQLFLEFVNPPYEIAIVGNDAAKLRDEMTDHYIPNSVFLGGTKEGELPLLEGKLDPDKTFIYVCQNKVCKFPVETVDQALSLIE